MKSTIRLIPGLAIYDLRHEFILSTCLVIAISSVIAPLLILLGLKSGTIKSLRKRLVNDPSFRELRPTETREYPRSWFEKMKIDEDVGFIIPTILPASSTVYLIMPGKKDKVLMDIIPTGKGDPLLEASQIRVPLGNECVLSFGAANKFGIKKGDTISLKVSRFRSGRYEYATQKLRVIGILPEQYGTLERIYAPLDLLLDIEAFKEGRAVSKRGWKGSFSRPYKRFDGVLVFSKRALDPLFLNSLLIESGLARYGKVSAKELEFNYGLRVPEEIFIYKFSVPRGNVTVSSYRAIKNRFRGFNARILPFTKPLPLYIGDKEIKVVGFSPDEKIKELLNAFFIPWNGFNEKRSGKDVFKIVLPMSFKEKFQKDSKIEVTFKGVKNVTFPVTIAGFTKGPFSYCPLELASMLNTARTKEIHFDKKSMSFILSTTGFRGFRLYAKTIDQVEPLYQKLKAQGIPVIAKLEAIRRIKILDSGLTRLFWLVAALGIIGAICVLTASLYGSVERKRSQLAVLRLLGFSRRDLFFFPVFEGLFLASFSSVLAVIGFEVVSGVINEVFKNEMRAGERICELSHWILFATLALTLLISGLSSLVGAWKTSRIDPAEALREE